MILQMKKLRPRGSSQLSKITQQVGDLPGSDKKPEYFAGHCDVFSTPTIGEIPLLLMLMHVPCHS